MKCISRDSSFILERHVQSFAHVRERDGDRKQSERTQTKGEIERVQMQTRAVIFVFCVSCNLDLPSQGSSPGLCGCRNMNESSHVVPHAVFCPEKGKTVISKHPQLCTSTKSLFC